MSAPPCLRCAGTALQPLPSPKGIAFFECPTCRRRFTRHASGALTERWLGPLSIALYAVIFEEHPQSQAARAAALLRSQQGAAHCALIASEIRTELSASTQPVREILPGMRASESDLREFLGRVADALEGPS
jgi:hypothetical protein